MILNKNIFFYRFLKTLYYLAYFLMPFVVLMITNTAGSYRCGVSASTLDLSISVLILLVTWFSYLIFLLIFKKIIIYLFFKKNKWVIAIIFVVAIINSIFLIGGLSYLKGQLVEKGQRVDLCR